MLSDLPGNIITLDREIKLQRQFGIEYEMPYEGKPLYAVTSLDPLSYKAFGVLRNKAPKLSGEVAVRGMLAVQGTLNPHIINPGMVFEPPEHSTDVLYAAVLSPDQYRELSRSVLSVHVGG